MKSLLYSVYIIDGVTRDVTPAQILGIPQPEGEIFDTVADETSDPDPGVPSFHSSRFGTYVDIVSTAVRSFPKPFSADYSRFRVASALIDMIWRHGHFSIGDLAVSGRWAWNDREMGNMAAFFNSVEAAVDYVDTLGLRLDACWVNEDNTLGFAPVVSLAEIKGDGDFFASQPYRTDSPVIADGGIPSVMEPDPQSWIVYIPFETSEFRLGGSLLSQASGMSGGVCPQIGDADYFLDCHEVVRELVEDGVVVSGTTVSDGGIALALKHFCGSGLGASVDVSDMMRAFGEQDSVRLMFAEVPGVLVQIRDNDYDYLDAELLLQDVLYFPLGHPQAGTSISVKASAKTGIQKILDSLIQNQGAEGED